MLNRFLKDCKVTRVANAAGAAQTDVTTSVLDMAGYDGVVFIALLGDITTSCVLTLTTYHHTANAASGTAITDGATTAATAGATDYDNNVLAVDVLKPSKRYVYAILSRGTANAVVDGILAVQYRCRSYPVTQPATLMQSAFSTPMA